MADIDDTGDLALSDIVPVFVEGIVDKEPLPDMAHGTGHVVAQVLHASQGSAGSHYRYAGRRRSRRIGSHQTGNACKLVRWSSNPDGRDAANASESGRHGEAAQRSPASPSAS